MALQPLGILSSVRPSTTSKCSSSVSSVAPEWIDPRAVFHGGSHQCRIRLGHHTDEGPEAASGLGGFQVIHPRSDDLPLRGSQAGKVIEEAVEIRRGHYASSIRVCCGVLQECAAGRRDGFSVVDGRRD